MNLIERAKDKLTSYYAVAKAAGVKPAYVYRVRDGEKPLSPDAAANIAEAIGEDGIRAALEALEAQAKNEEERKKWRLRIANYARAACAVIALGAVLPSESRPAKSGSLAQSVEQLAFNQLVGRLKRLLRKIAGFQETRLQAGFFLA